MGITDENRIYGIDDLAKGNVMFIATGVTHGSYLRGVRYTPYGATTHSIVMRSQTGTIREITSRHHFATKPNYGW
jgi:fructose-1,6-bisphosphatase II